MILDLKEQLLGEQSSLSSIEWGSAFDRSNNFQYNETHALNEEEIVEAIEENDFAKMKLRFKKIQNSIQIIKE